jgi:hypothetical protein
MVYTLLRRRSQVMKPKSEIISVAAKHIRRSTTHSPAAQTNVHIERVIGATEAGDG